MELAAEGLRKEDIVRWKAGQVLAQTKLGARFNPEVYPDAVGQPFARTNDDGFIEPYKGLSIASRFGEGKKLLVFHSAQRNRAVS